MEFFQGKIKLMTEWALLYIWLLSKRKDSYMENGLICGPQIIEYLYIEFACKKFNFTTILLKLTLIIFCTKNISNSLALGIIMYIMLTGTHPFVKDSDNEYSYSNRIASSDLQVSKNLQPIAKSLFQHLCSRTLSERYQAVQAIKHPWITRNPHDEVPCTQADQMRIMDAQN